ncbi:hypothetical protein BD413DRAFT_101679 [Trametes elegans]|nr:hypothetical protein BD413DRAFT_101679 [Trametes elegans]
MYLPLRVRPSRAERTRRPLRGRYRRSRIQPRWNRETQVESPREASGCQSARIDPRTRVVHTSPEPSCQVTSRMIPHLFASLYPVLRCNNRSNVEMTMMIARTLLVSDGGTRMLRASIGPLVVSFVVRSGTVAQNRCRPRTRRRAASPWDVRRSTSAPQRPSIQTRLHEAQTLRQSQGGTKYPTGCLNGFQTEAYRPGRWSYECKLVEDDSMNRESPLHEA